MTMQLFNEHGHPAICYHGHGLPVNKGKEVDEWTFEPHNNWKVLESAPGYGTLAICEDCARLYRFFSEQLPK